jgi:hypothetical protein
VTRTTLSDFIIALLDLMEAEGRVLRHSVTRTGGALALIGVAAALLLGALLLMLWSLYQFLEPRVGASAASLFTGLAMLVPAALAALAAQWLKR